MSGPERVPEIYLLGEAVLRERTPTVEGVTDEVRAYVEHLLRCMRLSGGIGLAAPQIGDSRRIAVAHADDRTVVLINPVVVESEGEQSMTDGCLSIPTVFATTTRAGRVTVETLGLDGRISHVKASGLLAFCIQHEIDHLNGRLFVDYLTGFKRNRAMKQWQAYLKKHPGALRIPLG